MKNEQMTGDDRSLFRRVLERVEKKCPWVHFVLLPLLTAAAVTLLIVASRVWHSVNAGAFLRLLLLGVLTASGVYAGYAESVWRSSKAPTVLPARVVNARRETYRVRCGEHSVCYLAFKPLDGSPYIELRVEESEMNRFVLGETGLLSYRPGEYISFLRQEFHD